MRFTKKVIFVGVAYLFLCGMLVILWDFVFAIEQLFLSNMIVGLLTIVGGFLLAYWLIESVRIQREAEQKERELERRKRVLSALKAFKNFLLPWLFQYACALSGRFLLYDVNRIYTGKYKEDIPELEDIFGIAVFDKNGKRLRGTDAHDSIFNEMQKRHLAPQFLYSDLNWGLRETKRIEERISEFPSLVEEVDPEVAKIVHLSEIIKSRITVLQEWEKEHDRKGINSIDDSQSNWTIRSNLRSVGRYALDAVIAIDTNIEKLEAILCSQ